MMQALRLRGISPGITDRVWESHTLFRVANSGAVEIVLDDASVSRRHAFIRKVDDVWWIRHMDSTSGTYVNGKQLAKDTARQIQPKDVVKFGTVAMQVELLDSNEILEVGLTKDPFGERIAILDSFSNRWSQQRCLDESLQSRLKEAVSSLDLSEKKSLDKFLESLAKSALSLVGAYCGGIALLDSNRVFEPFRSFSADERYTHWLDVRVAERCVKHRESIHYFMIPEHRENWAMCGTSCSPTRLFLPLRTKRNYLGALSLMGHDFFTQDDLRLADAFAFEVSPALAVLLSDDNRP